MYQQNRFLHIKRKVMLQKIDIVAIIGTLKGVLLFRTRLYEAQLSFNHGLKPRLISFLLNRVVRSSIIFFKIMD